MRKIYLLFIASFMLSTTSVWANPETPEVETEQADDLVKIGISVKGSKLYITNAEDLTVEVYNVTGVKVLSQKIDSNEKTIDTNLSRGCYIVKVGKVVRKVSIL